MTARVKKNSSVPKLNVSWMTRVFKQGRQLLKRTLTRKHNQQSKPRRWWHRGTRALNGCWKHCHNRGTCSKHCWPLTCICIRQSEKTRQRECAWDQTPTQQKEISVSDYSKRLVKGCEVSLQEIKVSKGLCPSVLKAYWRCLAWRWPGDVRGKVSWRGGQCGEWVTEEASSLRQTRGHFRAVQHSMSKN